MNLSARSANVNKSDVAAPLSNTPGQVNYLVPANAALGRATVSVSSTGQPVIGVALVSNVTPAIFTANLPGTGASAAQIFRVNAAGQGSCEAPFTGSGPTIRLNAPDLTASFTDKVYIVLYGTGIRRRSLNP